MLQEKVLKDLSSNGIANDAGFPVWIYKVDNLVVKNKRYLKIFLFNRQDTESIVNRIVFNHNGKEHTVESFSVISDYNDNNYVGCIIEIELEDTSSELTIVKEIVDGKSYVPENKQIRYHYPVYNLSEFNYLKRKGLLQRYPSVSDDYWQCTCGRINTKDTCLCGKNITQMNDIFNYDFTENRIIDFIQEYPLKTPLDTSFDDSIDSYAKRFSSINPDISSEELLNKFDLVRLRSEYTILLEQKTEKELKLKLAKEAKAKKTKTIAIIRTVLLLVFGGTAYILFAPKSTTVQTGYPDSEKYTYFSVELNNDNFEEYFDINSRRTVEGSTITVVPKTTSEGWYYYKGAIQATIEISGAKTLVINGQLYPISRKVSASNVRASLATIKGTVTFVNKNYVTSYNMNSNGSISIELKSGKTVTLDPSNS